MPADLTKAAICGSGQKMGSAPCINGLSATALKILGVLPQASGSSLLNNATNTQQTYTHGNQGDLKIDWAPSQNDHLFVRYTQQHVENPTVKSTRLNSSHLVISYAVFCLKKKKN